MSADNWRELLRRDEIAPAIRNIVTATHARTAARYGTNIDVESHAWDLAVRLAERFDGPDNEFVYYLAHHIDRWAWLGAYKDHVGYPGGSEEAAVTTSISLDYVRNDGADLSDWIHSRTQSSSRRITNDDPLAILMHIESLERALRKANATPPTAGANTCADPACSKPPTKQGRCERHYRQHLALWGKANSTACSHPDCTALAVTRGMCNPHYQADRFQQKQAGTWQPKTTPSTCTVEGCDRRYEARGYCNTHYKRWRKSGTIELPASA